MPDRIRLDGKVAVVTGAAGVIGTATIRLLADRGACATTGVRVNCVCPGLIDSRMLSAIIEGRNPTNAPVPNEKIVDRIPARRLGQASEVASIVAFLASDDASYVSGAAYTVDGGRVAS
jgi:NAD(P)-dependent dehydrogenase (short-subunit alcohol dehydrogenase family)